MTISLNNRKLKIALFDRYGKEVATITATHITALNSQTWITELKGTQTINHYLTEKLTGINSIDGLITLYYEGERFIEITRC